MKKLLEKEKMQIAIGMIISFLFHILVLNQFECWFCTDTDGYWLHAATFTGHDWSNVAKNMNYYYSWGYSVLLIIPFMISENIFVMCKIAVLINVLLCSLIVPLVYSIGKRIVPEMERHIVLVFAIIVSNYSTYILESAVSLAEVFLYFLTFLILYFIYNFFETGKEIWGILSGVTVGYIYIVHNRCIGIVIAYMVIVTLFLIRERNWKTFLILVMPLLVMLLLKYGVNSWLNQMENTSGTYTMNTYQSKQEKIKQGITLYSIISLVQNLLGEFWYASVGTFLLAAFGVVEIVKNRIIPLQKKRISLFYIYVLISWIFLVGVSAVNFVKSAAVTEGRMDLIFYGRYMESSVGILMFFGLIYLYKVKKEELKQIGLVIVFTVWLSVLIYYFTTDFINAGVNWFSVVAVLIPFSYSNMEISIVKSSIVLIGFAIFIIYLFLMKKKIYKYVACISICGMFLFIGYNASYAVSRTYAENASVENNPTYNKNFNDICKYVEENNIDTLYVYTANGYEACSYQLVMQKRKIISITQPEDLNNLLQEDLVLIKKNEVIPEGICTSIIYDNDLYNVCKVGVVNN